MDKITSTASFGNDAQPGLSADDWRKDTDPWTVTLSFQGRSMKIPFWTGYGWKSAPTTADVMRCLVSDAGTLENSSDATEWADELGYDYDPDVEDRYDRVVQQTQDLKELLGEHFEAIVFECDDLAEWCE